MTADAAADRSTFREQAVLMTQGHKHQGPYLPHGKKEPSLDLVYLFPLLTS